MMPYPYFNSYQQGYNPYPAYQPAPQSSIVWVDGAQEAEAYPLAPNNAVALWDRKQSCIYVKQTDATGRAGMRVLEYRERTAEQTAPESTTANLATKDDVTAIVEAVRRIEKYLADKEATENV